VTVLISRWTYYLRSISTLLLRIQPRARVLATFLRLARRPFRIQLDDGCRFKVRNRMDVWIIKETCLDRDYERDAVAVEDGWTVVDIGAGLGDFAVCVARRCPRSIVFAFEPLPESFALLRENIEDNGLENVRPFPEAIAGQSGEVFLAAATGVAVQHRVTMEESKATVRTPVRAVTLREAFEKSGIGRCDFLKIDCEGAEYEILFAADELTLSQIRHIALEYHDGTTPHSHSDLERYLEGRGFRVRRRKNPAHEDLGFLFASKEVRGP
jgi:FkbM family methyltransferase